MIDPAYKNQPILIVEQTEQVFPLNKDLLTIGRKTGNTIILGNDLKASRHHATIRWETGTYIIQDVGSSNGTYLNERRLKAAQPLSNGDVIRVGDTKFKVRLPLKDTEPNLSKDAQETMISTEPVAMTASSPPPRQDTDVVVLPGQPVVQTINNPYVGPRTFAPEESDRFYGREGEARELLSLVISQRMVLFYAQSGAGKSSLINTRLVPLLRQEGRAVLPIGRVSGDLPEGVRNVDNLYIFNLLLSLDESDGDPTRFTNMTLSEFLIHLTSLDGVHYYYDDQLETNEFELDEEVLEADEYFEETPYVLIVDQFEEIVTTHPDRWQEREGFFSQLAQAMSDDPLLWVVLTLREDYIAPLDPYMHHLPDKLRARFYMQRMAYEAALEAVQKPAEYYERPFAAGVAEGLVNNLRQIRVQGVQVQDKTKTKPGQFIEPVQLQVVCFQLWENLKDRPFSEITQQDVVEMGDVDQALAQFYEQALQRVLDQTDISEIELRSWFDTQLITEAGTKGTVYQGRSQTGGIPNEAVTLLSNQYLLRAEVRGGGTWYELVHDRFVNPILQSNQAWRSEQPLLQMAHAWVERERSDSILLEGQQLKAALQSNWHGLGPQVEEFMEASQSTQRAKDAILLEEKERLRQQELNQAQALAEEQRKRAEEQTKAALSLRRRAWFLGFLGIIAFLMAGAAVLSASYARQATFAAQENEAIANAQAEVASTEQAKAIQAQETAEAQFLAAEANAAVARDYLQGQSATETAVAVSMMAENEAEIKELNEQKDSLVATVTADAQLAQAMASDAEATATLLTELSEDTPTITATPTGPYSPPTSTSMPTSTPTLDPAPTQTAEANIAALAQVESELEGLTVADQGCMTEADRRFRGIWQRYEATLGCPRQPEAVGGFGAEQPFEDGFMIWSQILGLFFVANGDEEAGIWTVFTTEQVEAMNPNEEGISCPANVPEGLYQPIRGFGAIWCQDNIRGQMGFGTIPEYGVQNNLVQSFENGFIVRNDAGQIYALFLDDRTYRKEN